MSRITDKHLDGLVNRLNKLTNSPLDYYDKTSAKFKVNVGHFKLDSAYGGNKLVRVDNASGGECDISIGGYITKSALYDQIVMLIKGYELANKEKVA